MRTLFNVIVALGYTMMACVAAIGYLAVGFAIKLVTTIAGIFIAVAAVGGLAFCALKERRDSRPPRKPR